MTYCILDGGVSPVRRTILRDTAPGLCGVVGGSVT